MYDVNFVRCLLGDLLQLSQGAFLHRCNWKWARCLQISCTFWLAHNPPDFHSFSKKDIPVFLQNLLLGLEGEDMVMLNGPSRHS